MDTLKIAEYDILEILKMRKELLELGIEIDIRNVREKIFGNKTQSRKRIEMVHEALDAEEQMLIWKAENAQNFFILKCIHWEKDIEVKNQLVFNFHNILIVYAPYKLVVEEDGPAGNTDEHLLEDSSI